MDTPRDPASAFDTTYGTVSFLNSQGVATEAPVTHLTRHQVVFALHNPEVLLRASEVLAELKIRLNGRPKYSGRAVVNKLIPIGTGAICEATLEESWLDVALAPGPHPGQRLQQDLGAFLQSSQAGFQVIPEFKLAVADMQHYLMDLRGWLEQVELGVRSQTGGDPQELEREVIQHLKSPLLPMLSSLFERFENACDRISPELQPAHRNYVKRQIHPLVLCAPFMYRTFIKPLGYAGDYEMVNMMMRDPHEGSSIYAKVLNSYFLDTAPVVAHRNRLAWLQEMLVTEVARTLRSGRRTGIFNLGCGPARELQDFVAHNELSTHTDLTLLDFNDETLAHTGRLIEELKTQRRRATTIQTVKRSIAQFIKEASKPASAFSSASFDLVYCAGLFDYLPDHVCERLMNILYAALAPGGLLVVTNVDESNPDRNWMEYSVDWHLIYRNHDRMLRLRPDDASPEDCRISADSSGVNIFLEVRKPHA